MDNKEIILRKNIADKLRILRAKNRISQEVLAEKSSLTQAYIYKMENELVNPSIYVMYRIAEALNVSVNDLIY